MTDKTMCNFFLKYFKFYISFKVRLLLLLIAIPNCITAAEVNNLEDDNYQTTTTKWHPGHYILLYPSQSRAYFNSVMRDLQVNPAFRGVQKKYLWKDLEPEFGVYNFSEIESDLANLARINKQLVLTVQAESFLNKEIRVPDYLLTDTYSGGVYPINSGQGFNAAYYNANVQERMIALLRALGKEFDSHPNLEALNLEETSPGRQEPEWHRAYFRNYITGMMRVAVEAKMAFPTTVVIQYVNYPETALPMITRTLKSHGIGIGGPDVYEKNPHLAKGIYSYYPSLSGVLPIGMAVDYHNYQSSVGGSAPVDNPSIASIHQFAQRQMNPNYMFWLRRTGDGRRTPDYWGNVLQYMKKYNGQNDASGGLNTNCPTAIMPCRAD